MNSTYNTEPVQRKPDISKIEPCRHCGAVDGFSLRENGPHLGAYCVGCEGWLRWVPRNTLPPINNSPRGDFAKPEVATCNPAGEISRLLRSISAIERELSIIVRVLVNGKPS